jgi:hypothetical protein
MTRPLVLAAALALAGCASQQTPPAPSDPAAAKTTLQKTLDGWKKGDTLDAFKKANPDVNVVDRPWQAGGKLADYEIAAKSEMKGYDVTFDVKLTWSDAAGKKTTEKVTYTVSTTPALVVIRTEAGG